MSWVNGRDTRRVLTVTYQVRLGAKPTQTKSWWPNPTPRSSALFLGYQGRYAIRNISGIGPLSSKGTAGPSSPLRAKPLKLQIFFDRSPENIAKELARIAKYPYVADRKQEASLTSTMRARF
jgi:hypothetical protein